jgi:response regulator RpfG family c-di-GMP phosphodiesterase
MNQEAEKIAPKPATLLFIDDEENILSSLKRLFRPFGYTIHTASSGPEGLAFLEKEPVDLVICDMRMPQMTGAEVFEKLRAKWPHIARVLLTGYADLHSTIEAINRGEIYRYIAKPWDDHDILLVVRDALERKHLLEEKERLEKLTIDQNLKLSVMNASLEEKVAQRTQELHEALERLRKDYFSTLQVFANLMELRKGAMAGHSRRIAQLCRNIAHQMQLPEQDIRNIEVAALLHNLGKIGLPDHLLDRPYMDLSYAEKSEFDKHPLRAAAALMALDPLLNASQVIQHYSDHYNGEGNDSKARGERIPLGSRILLVAADFEELQQGLIGHEKLSPDQAVKMIVTGKNTRYDPLIVDIFTEIMSHASNYGPIAKEFLVVSKQLHEGMLLTRDVLTHNGMLLLLKNTTLNSGHIRAIHQYEQTAGEQLTIYTHTI